MDTEDGLLHCIKPGGVAADAAATISAEKAMLIAGKETNFHGSYPYASDEQLVDNETVMNDNYM